MPVSWAQAVNSTPVYRLVGPTQSKEAVMCVSCRYRKTAVELVDAMVSLNTEVIERFCTGDVDAETVIATAETLAVFLRQLADHVVEEARVWVAAAPQMELPGHIRRHMEANELMEIPSKTVLSIGRELLESASEALRSIPAGEGMERFVQHAIEEKREAISHLDPSSEADPIGFYADRFGM